MQASIENLEGLKRRITVTVPAEDVKKAYAASLRKYAKNVRLDGFRKGHVPTKVLENYYGASIMSDVVDALIKDTLFKAIDECGAVNASAPEIGTESAFDPQADFTYKATFEVFPQVEDKPLSEMPLKVVNSEISDADVDKMIERLRMQQSKWQVNEAAEVADGKLAKIDFVGRVDGVEFEHGSAKDYSLYVGHTSMIPGFTEQIIGHKAGDHFNIQVTFPEDYHEESLKGKNAEFEITVNSVSDQIMPELNADFFKLFGTEDGSYETFRADLLRNMEREQSKALIRAQRDNVCSALLDYFGPFEIPAAAVDNERKRMCEADVEHLKSYRIPVKQDPYSDPERHKTDAENSVRLSCIIQHFVEKSGLKSPSDESVESILSMIADAYEDPEMVKREIRKDSKQFSSIRNQAFEHDVFNYIQNNSKCEQQQVSFFELLELAR